jgi:hypothetical protein
MTHDDDLWDGWDGMETEAPAQPNPFKAGTEEHAAWERQEAQARTEVAAGLEQRRTERRKRELEAATDNELLRLEARKAAEQIYNDKQHIAAEALPEDAGSTWAPTDLTTILDGTHIATEPTLMPRTDGIRLLYPGRVHTFAGESESGKSMVAQAEAARILLEGGTVAYLDFESDASVVVGRILQMGALRDDIAERFLYMRPGVRPQATADDRRAWKDLIDRRLDLAVIDGVTEAASVFGVVSKDNDEITTWNRAFARPLAHRTGAAVIQVDHVTKDAESRGRFAIGAQAKMAGLDGASYVVEVKEPLGRGMRGVISMRIAKDREGGIRPHCGPFRTSDRTQEACRVVVDSTSDGLILVTVEPPAVGVTEQDGQPAEFRPTALMERVSLYLEGENAPVSENQITQNVVGKAAMVRKAVAALVDERYVNRFAGARSANMHQLLARYRQTEDPKSDKYQPPIGVTA